MHTFYIIYTVSYIQYVIHTVHTVYVYSSYDILFIPGCTYVKSTSEKGLKPLTSFPRYLGFFVKGFSVTNGMAHRDASKKRCDPCPNISYLKHRGISKREVGSRLIKTQEELHKSNIFKLSPCVTQKSIHTYVHYVLYPEGQLLREFLDF